MENILQGVEGLKFLVNTPNGKTTVQIIRKGNEWYVRRLNYKQFESETQTNVRDIMKKAIADLKARKGVTTRKEREKAVRDAFRNYKAARKKTGEEKIQEELGVWQTYVRK